MHKIIILILMYLAVGCTYSNSNNNTKGRPVTVNELLDQNKNKFLFLSFWAGMNDLEFHRIIKYENDKGNLNNGKFLLLTSQGNVPFEVITDDYSVKLQYNDEQWIDYKDNPFYVANRIPNGKSYHYIESTIVDLFDKKYIRINPSKDVELTETEKILKSLEDQIPNKDDTHDTYIQWQTINETPSRIISLSSNYSYFYKTFNNEISFSGESSRFHYDRDKKKVRIGYCSIAIYYELLEKYLEREKEHKLWEIEQRNQSEKEQIEIEKKIQQHNNRL